MVEKDKRDPSTVCKKCHKNEVMPTLITEWGERFGLCGKCTAEMPEDVYIQETCDDLGFCNICQRNRARTFAKVDIYTLMKKDLWYKVVGQYSSLKVPTKISPNSWSEVEWYEEKGLAIFMFVICSECRKKYFSGYEVTAFNPF